MRHSFVVLLVVAGAFGVSGQEPTPPPHSPFTFTTLDAELPGIAQVAAGIATDGRDIYLFGGAIGHASAKISKSILRFDTQRHTIRIIEPTLPTPRWLAPAVWDGQRYLIFGGARDIQGQEPLGDIIAFDPSLEKVTTLATRLPTPRWGMGAATDGTSIWLFGGQNSDKLRDVVRYDIKSGAIETLAVKLPDIYVAKSMSAAVWAEGAAYLFGGWETGREVIRFDPGGPQGGTARLLTEPGKVGAQGSVFLAQDVDDGAAFYDGSAIYALGADDRITLGAPSHLVRFDMVEQNSAVLADTFPASRDEFAMVYVAPNAYIFGGNDRDPTPEILCLGRDCTTHSPVPGAKRSAHEGCSALEPPRTPAWPMARGNERGTNNADDSGPLNTSVWQHAAGDGWSAPVVAGCRLFIGNASSVDAYDVRDGTLLWRGRVDGAVEGSPAVDGTNIYVATDRPAMYAFDAATGRALWSGTIGPGSSQPVVSGDRVLVGSTDGYIYALDARNGAAAWRYQTGDAVRAPTIDAATGAVWYASKWNGRVGGLLLSSGTVRVGPAALDTGAEATSDTVWTGDTLLFTASDRLVAVDPLAGQRLWIENVTQRNGILTAPAADGRLVVVADDLGYVYGVDLLNGAILWQTNVGFSFTSAPALREGVAYVASTDGQLHAFETYNGTRLWSIQLSGPIAAPPALAFHSVFVATKDGNLFAISSNGKTSYVPPPPKSTASSAPTTPGSGIPDRDATPSSEPPTSFAPVPATTKAPTSSPAHSPMIGFSGWAVALLLAVAILLRRRVA